MLARKKDEAEWGIIRCVSDTMGNSITHDTCEAHHAPVRQSVSFNSFAFDARRVRARPTIVVLSGSFSGRKRRN
jgi:hypothetical protein